MPKRSSTSSFQAKGRSDLVSRYGKCPICESNDISLGTERVTIPRGARKVNVTVERWECAHCGEKFLTEDSRRKIDEALGLAARKSA